MSHYAPNDDRPDFMVLLGLLPPYLEEDIRKAYKEKAKVLHPDRGGDPESFNRLRSAYDRALDYSEFRKSRREWLAAQVVQYTEHLELVSELKSLGCVLKAETEDWRSRSWGDFAQVTESILEIRASGTEFGDEFAELLSERRELLESIRLIDMSDSRLTDAGLRCLTSLSELLRIDVRQTGVSADGVKQTCSQLKRLEAIHVGQTAVGWLRRLNLRRAFPDVEFITDMTAILDSSPRSRYTSLAQMAMG